MAAFRFEGVLPAITTPFRADGTIDHEALAAHARWLLDEGSDGLVALGSLGEAATLDDGEKRDVLRTVVRAAAGAPVIAGIAAAATRQATALAELARAEGCRGLMVLPAYLHRGEPREALAHVAAVIAATPLPCMLYNNPPAYGTDFTPDLTAQLALAHDNLVAVKESSGDARRFAALRAAADRLHLLVGLDDLLLEGVAMGAVGWVAGLANALPKESRSLFAAARAGRDEEAWALYRWFLPLLRLDALPEFVQAIKLVQQETGHGSERVRPPRLPLAGPLRERTLATIRTALASRPRLA